MRRTERRAIDRKDMAGDVGIALLLAALAALPRLWGLSGVGLTHFDEGAYAMSALAVARGELPDGLYPLQHYLSPPLFFGLAGLVMKALGTASDLIPILLSAVLGILTVPLVFLVGRVWHGRAAGAAAGVLLALSGFHVAWSRTGLTDVAFCFLFALALLLCTLAERKGSLRLALLAGLCIGLAWNVKYHGWLAGIVVVLGLVPALLRERGRQRRSRLARLAACLGAAGLLYLPWFVFVLTRPGGYGRLLAEHASFLSGWREVLQHMAVHYQAQLQLDGPVGRLAPALALAAAAALGAPPRRAGLLVLFFGPPLAFLGWALGEAGLAVVASLAGVLVVLRRHTPGAGVSLAFLGVFSVLTPLYRPYPRLLLPWTLSAFLLAGAAFQALVDRVGRPAGLSGRAAPPAAAAALAALVLLVHSTPPPEPWSGAGSGFRGPSTELARRVPPEAPVYVVGEPAVVFYLRAQGREARHVDHPAQALARHGSGEVIYVVGGHYSRLVGEIARACRRTPEAWQRVARLPAHVGTVRLLDDLTPAGARAYRRTNHGEYDLEVFRVTVPVR